jgi:hypothetical protein
MSALFLASSFFEAMKDAVPAGVLLALAGHLFTQAKNRQDIEEKCSQFNLDGMRLAFAHARSLLEDENNRRATWIEAARVISHGLELAKGVTAAPHQRVLEVEHLKYRSVFFNILASRSAAFFYGVPEVYATLDEAASASTAPRNEHGRRVTSANDGLDEPSIRAVWLAAQWPANYQDPMGATFTSEEDGKLMLWLPNLHTFIQHTRHWHSASGRLHPRRAE